MAPTDAHYEMYEVGGLGESGSQLPIAEATRAALK
jgi:hypothetical protein